MRSIEAKVLVRSLKIPMHPAGLSRVLTKLYGISSKASMRKLLKNEGLVRILQQKILKPLTIHPQSKLKALLILNHLNSQA